MRISLLNRMQGAFLILLAFFLASCGALSGSNNLSTDSQSTTDTESFSTGEPVDIPITMSKVMKPIDATTVTIEELTTTDLSFAYRITGRTQELDAPYVKAFHNGTLIKILAVQSGFFTFDTDDSEVLTNDPDFANDPLDRSLAFVVVDDPDSEDASNAVIIRSFLLDDPLSDSKLAFNAQVTNMEGVGPQEIDFAPDFTAIFNGTGDNDAPVLGQIFARGGEAEVTANIPDTLSQIQVSSDGSFAVGASTEDGLIYYVDLSTGETQVLNDTPIRGRNLSLSPDDRYVATVNSVADPTGVKKALAIIAIDNEQSASVVNPVSGKKYFMEMDWINDHEIVVLSQATAGGEAKAETYNLTPIVSGNFQGGPIIIRPTFLASFPYVSNTDQLSPISDPQVLANAESFVFLCRGVGGVNNICQNSFNSSTTRHTTTGSLGHIDIGHLSPTADSQNVLAHIAFRSRPQISQYFVMKLNLATSDTSILTKGFNPKADHDETSFFSYLSLSEEDEDLQITTGNLENLE